MGEVAVGDQLIGADGRPTTVVAATEVMLGRPCFEVEFSDGTVIVADAEHQWLTETRRGRGGRPDDRRDRARRSGPEPADGSGQPLGRDHALPLQLPTRRSLSTPYTLGRWPAVEPWSTAAADRGSWMMRVRRRADGDRHRTPAAAPPAGGRLPVALLRGSARPAALPAGRAARRGRHGLGDRLHPAAGAAAGLAAGDVRELVVSLGYRVAGDRIAALDGASYVLRRRRRVPARAQAAGAQGAAVGQRRAHDAAASSSTYGRSPSVPVRCVEVDNADHLYLAGRSMMPTHNSTLGLDFARRASVKHNLASGIFSLEMSTNEITMRLLSAEARVPLHAHALRPAVRRRLDPAGPADGRGRRGAALRRRLART